MNRVLADTNHVTQHWERRCDELPYLMVKMSDGRTIRYNPEVQQPGFQKAIQNIRNMQIGYERKQTK